MYYSCLILTQSWKPDLAKSSSSLTDNVGSLQLGFFTMRVSQQVLWNLRQQHSSLIHPSASLGFWDLIVGGAHSFPSSVAVAIGRNPPPPPKSKDTILAKIFLMLKFILGMFIVPAITLARFIGSLILIIGAKRLGINLMVLICSATGLILGQGLFSMITILLDAWKTLNV